MADGRLWHYFQFFFYGPQKTPYRKEPETTAMNCHLPYPQNFADLHRRLRMNDETELLPQARPFVAAILLRAVREPLRSEHVALIRQFHPEQVTDKHVAFALWTKFPEEAADPRPDLEAAGELNHAWQAYRFVLTLQATAQALQAMRLGPRH